MRRPHSGRPRTAPRSRARTSRGSTGGAPSSRASRSPGCRFDDAGLEELVTRRLRVRAVRAHRRPDGRRAAPTARPSCPAGSTGRSSSTSCGRAASSPARSSWAPTWRPMTSTEQRLELHLAAGRGPVGAGAVRQRFREADLTDTDLRECDLTGAEPRPGPAAVDEAARRRPARRLAGRGQLARFELTGVRIDLIHAVQFARAHGRSSRTSGLHLSRAR